jgi:hypothetical protein
LKEPLQNRSAVAPLTSRRIDQGDRAGFGFAPGQLDQIVFATEFLLVTPPELIPLALVMPGPFS